MMLSQEKHVTGEVKKQIFLIWDLDGAIGQINSALPYNFNYKQLQRELDNVHSLLDKLDEYGIKCCFAITGFSAEEGIYPYVFPDLIREISKRGHEIASHTWRHEWIPLFRKGQIEKSLRRSKEALERCIGKNDAVVGFVPPHNRPMSWISRGAFSFGDRGVFPFFEMGDNGSLMKLLNKVGYKWVRISFHPFLKKILPTRIPLAGEIKWRDNLMIMENHHTGFDDQLLDHVLNGSDLTHTISAHPLMIDYPDKSENMKNFEDFIVAVKKREGIEFLLPGDYGAIDN
jgi:peptidoglycan/xylan/chitin deacetylase (PgdA/CDA1 family)